MISIKTNQTQETFALGKKFAKLLKGGEIIALKGSLGSGKTTFVKGLAKGLKIGGKVVSPSFVVMSVYQLPKGNHFYHFDLYRLSRAEELLELGFSEILHDKKNIVIVEWAEKAKKLLPRKTLYVRFDHGQKLHERKIQIDA